MSRKLTKHIKILINSNMKAIIVLSPETSKKLIAFGVKNHPSAKNAYKHGWVILNSGSTNAYIYSALTGGKVDPELYCAGKISEEGLNLTPTSVRISPVYLQKGKPSKKSFEEVLTQLTPSDVFIKGFNAIDSFGNAGVWLGGEGGGTIGKSIGTLVQKGCKVLLAGGLEKLVFDVQESAEFCNDQVDYFSGMNARMILLSGFEFITEIEALSICFEINAVLLGSGGLGESAGAVVLGLEGDSRAVKKAVNFIEKLKKD